MANLNTTKGYNLKNNWSLLFNVIIFILILGLFSIVGIAGIGAILGFIVSGIVYVIQKYIPKGAIFNYIEYCKTPLYLTGNKYGEDKNA